MRILKPGREQKPGHYIRRGLCTVCGCEIEASGEEGKKQVMEYEFDCPTKNCHGHINTRPVWVEEGWK